MKLYAQQETTTSGTRYLLAAVLPLYYTDPVEKFRKMKYKATASLEALANSEPIMSELQKSLQAMFPTLTHINLYVGTTDANKGTHYISLTRKTTKDKWRVTNRSVRQVRKAYPRAGVLVRWGTLASVSSPDKAITLTPHLKRINVGKDLIESHTPEAQAQLRRCIQIANTLQKKTKPILTVWGNPGKVVFSYDEHEVVPIRTRYGGSPPTERYPVIFYGLATPPPVGPYSDQPTVIAPIYPTSPKLPEETDYRLRIFLDVATTLHNFVGIVAPEITQSEDPIVYAASYNIDFQSYDYAKINTKKKVPLYLFNGDKWTPNDRALLDLLHILAYDQPNAKWVHYLFTLLSLPFDLGLIETAATLGIDFEENEIELLQKSISQFLPEETL